MAHEAPGPRTVLPARGNLRKDTIMEYLQEREINLAARFFPMTVTEPEPIETDPVSGGPGAYDPSDGGSETHPCIEIGGVQVYAYFDDGVLNISLHYDTADDAVLTDAGTVPTVIRGGGGEVIWQEG